MYTKKITLLCKGLALTTLFFFTSNFSFGQTCNSAGSQDVTLTGIEAITVSGSGTAAKNKYKKAIADAAVAGGLASCGTCTVGNCEAKFGSYASGSSTPNGRTTDGSTTFQAPPDGELSFSVSCGCVVAIAIEIREEEYEGGPLHSGGQIDGNHDHFSGFAFYPNPATSDQISLSVNLEEAIAPTTIRIHNTQGQLMVEKALGSLTKGQHQFEIDIHDLTPGIYFASIHSDGKVWNRSRIVIHE